MTKAERKKQCIEKWKWIIENDGKLDRWELMDEIPELGGLENNCGYCEYNKKTRVCPLAKLKNTTCKDGHLRNKRDSFFGCVDEYEAWAKDENVKNARELLKLIRRS